ncbi:MAG: chromate transporter, partial [Clostridiaceae bacterium]|nr:chromate transporter [Clostridiaceae bacterium]
MIYLQLFWEFFKTGLFAIGGGLATIPFLRDITLKYPWFTPEDLLDMIAISESTPGPMGVNSATYAGFHAAGLPGALAATFSLVLPSVIIIILVSRALTRFRDSKLVQDG